MNKRILFVALVLATLFAGANTVSATTISQVKNEKKNTEKKLDAINENIENMEEEIENLEEEAEIYQQELVDLLVTIQIINSDIETKENDINVARSELEAAIAKQESQKLAMKTRIKYLYEKGDSSYIQTILEAKKYADAVNKATYSEKLYAYDRYQLYLYEQTKQEVLDKKQLLEEDLEELEEVKADATEQEVQLQILIDEYSEKIENFDEELAEAKNKANEFKNQIKRQSDSIKAMELEERRKAEEAAKKKAEEEARRKAEEEARRKALEEEERRRQEEESIAESEEESGDIEVSDESDDNAEEDTSEKKKKKKEEEPKEEIKEEPKEEPKAESSGGSGLGQDIANYACQFIGNPYVAGGTSLTNGADCSGFTTAVYEHFGISLPRTSGSQAMCGKAVSYAEAQPGDIIYYGGHVGIYIGNGQIVHASTQATGIKISSALYRSIISVRRII